MYPYQMYMCICYKLGGDPAISLGVMAYFLFSVSARSEAKKFISDRMSVYLARHMTWGVNMYKVSGQ
jgi:hypothetical protein